MVYLVGKKVLYCPEYNNKLSQEIVGVFREKVLAEKALHKLKDNYLLSREYASDKFMISTGIMDDFKLDDKFFIVDINYDTIIDLKEFL